jgi:hypothetical protein
MSDNYMYNMSERFYNKLKNIEGDITSASRCSFTVLWKSVDSVKKLLSGNTYIHDETRSLWSKECRLMYCNFARYILFHKSAYITVTATSSHKASHKHRSHVIYCASHVSPNPFWLNHQSSLPKPSQTSGSEGWNCEILPRIFFTRYLF